MVAASPLKGTLFSIAEGSSLIERLCPKVVDLVFDCDSNVIDCQDPELISGTAINGGITLIRRTAGRLSNRALLVADLAAAFSPQLPMPGIEAFAAQSSLTARRSAASSLPSFALPPPSLEGFHGKYQSFGAGGNTQSQPHSVSLASMGSLLTPPNSNTHVGDLLSFGSSSGNNNMAQPAASSSYNSASSYWPLPSQQNGQYTYGGGVSGQLIPPRGLFSPPQLNSFGRTGSNNSSTVVESPLHHQGPSYDTGVQLPPFSVASMSMSPPLPAMSANGQHASMYSNQNMNTSNSRMSPHSPVSNQDSFGIRPSPISTYFNQPHPPPNNFSYPLPSPSSATSNQPQRVSLISAADMSTIQQPTSQSANQYSRPYSNFSLPAMNNSSLSTLHGSGSPIPFVGGVQPNSGLTNAHNHAPSGGSTQHMYLPGSLGQPGSSLSLIHI